MGKAYEQEVHINRNANKHENCLISFIIINIGKLKKKLVPGMMKERETGTFTCFQSNVNCRGIFVGHCGNISKFVIYILVEIAISFLGVYLASTCTVM